MLDNAITPPEIMSTHDSTSTRHKRSERRTAFIEVSLLIACTFVAGCSDPHDRSPAVNDPPNTAATPRIQGEWRVQRYDVANTAEVVTVASSPLK
jgi:hypothetical protein